MSSKNKKNRKKHTDETKKKISLGVKRSRDLREKERMKQQFADDLMNNFENGSGTKPKRLLRIFDQEEYGHIYDTNKPLAGMQGAMKKRRENRHSINPKNLDGNKNENHPK